MFIILLFIIMRFFFSFKCFTHYLTIFVILCLWSIDILTSDLRMSSLLPLEKENLHWWCQSMVSSRASLIHVFIWRWLLLLRLYCFANCNARFFFLVFVAEKFSLWMSMQLTLKTLILYLSIRDGQQGRYLIGIVTHCQDLMFLLKECRELLLSVIL